MPQDVRGGQGGVRSRRIDGADGAVAESGDIERPMEGEVISSGPNFLYQVLRIFYSKC